MDGGVDSVTVWDAVAVDAIEVDSSTESCNLVLQSGCADGQKCTLIADQESGEISIGCTENGSDPLYGMCDVPSGDTPDSCMAGHLCDGFDVKRCLEFCESMPDDTCSEDQVCSYNLDIDNDNFADAHLCASRCSPLDQDCSYDEMGCYPSRSGPICAPIGAGEEPVSKGGLCVFGNSCEKGLGCFRLSGTTDWRCFQLCALGERDGPTCGAQEICNQIEDEDWGICMEPLPGLVGDSESMTPFDFRMSLWGEVGVPAFLQ